MLQVSTRFIAVMGAAVAVFLAAPGPMAGAESKPRAAMMLPGQGVNDYGFGYAGYLALQSLEKELGFDVKLVENISSPDIEPTARDFAGRGYEVIFGHGFENQSHFMRVAPRFPDTKFVVVKGAPAENVPSNLLIIDIKEHEPAYILGVLAAHLSQSGKVGGIAGFPYGTIIRIMEAYKDGARSVDPDMTVGIAYAGSWNDPVLGKELALSQIDEGADLVYAHASVTSLGVFEAAEERGVLAFGSVLDQHELAPKSVVAGSLYNFPEMFQDVANMIMEDRFEGGFVSYGMAQGVLDVTDLYGAAKALPPEIKDEIQTLRQAIISGDFEVEEIREKR